VNQDQRALAFRLDLERGGSIGRTAALDIAALRLDTRGMLGVVDVLERDLASESETGPSRTEILPL